MSNSNQKLEQIGGPTTTADQIDLIANVCMEVNELMQAHGTESMKMLMRMLLLEIGHEIASHQVATRDDAGDE